MSCYQIAYFRPQVNLKAKYHGDRGLPPPTAHIPAVRFPTIPRTYRKLSAQRLKYQWRSPACLLGGKDKSEGNNQDPPWKGLQDTFGNIGGEPSVEEMLRKQIQKQEYVVEEAGGGGDDDDGGRGGGGRSSRRGRGGGGGADDDDDDDSEDSRGGKEETFAEVMDEILQMTLATIGLLVVYFYLLYPQDIKLYARDIVRFFLTRKKSQRVKEITDAFEEFWDRLTYTKEPEDEGVPLEELILNTTTWWDSPEKNRRLNKQYVKDDERIDFDSFDFTPFSGNVADAQIDSDDESGDTANAESGKTAADDRACADKIDWEHLFKIYDYPGGIRPPSDAPVNMDNNDISSGDTSRTAADMDDDDISSGDTDSADVDVDVNDDDDDDDDDPDDGYDSGTDDTDSDS